MRVFNYIVLTVVLGLGCFVSLILAMVGCFYWSHTCTISLFVLFVILLVATIIAARKYKKVNDEDNAEVQQDNNQ